MHKNTFGHVLILAGSPNMLGAAALSALAAMRSGAGLVTLGVPKSLNLSLHKKLSSEIMTIPLAQTQEHTLALGAYQQISKNYKRFNVIAIGPGLSQNHSTQKLILKIIETAPIPLVIDADALNALSGSCASLLKTRAQKILTPHPGEMARLIGCPKTQIEKNRKSIAEGFSRRYSCVLLLKGHQSIIACPGKKTYTNTTGNPGMASAGSGDVLTGMIAGLQAQGLSSFDAAKWGAYLHGLAGDLGAKEKGRLSLIATDLIHFIPLAIKQSQ